MKQMRWEQFSPANPPSGGGTTRYVHGMAFDKTNGEMIIFGGSPSTDDNTYSLTPATFTTKSPATRPGPRQDIAFCFDEANANILMFGGDKISFPSYDQTDETWTWDGSTWTHETPAHSPPARRAATIASTPTYTLLFGGVSSALADYFDDTWKWESGDWTQLSPSTVPHKRMYHAMGYDAVSDTVIMYGGSNGGSLTLKETWEWDGSDWTQLSPATAPEMYSNAGLTWHPGLEMLVMAHGFRVGPGGDPNTDQVWAWTRSDWTLIDTCSTSIPDSRNSHGWAYDNNLRKIVMYAGDTSTGGLGASSDVWAFGAGCGRPKFIRRPT